MKENYNNKTKLRSAWLALVLLMITALPITAQNVRDRFEVDSYWYEVVDAAKHTVKLTYANENAKKADARNVNLASSTDKLPNDDQWKGYNGTPKEEEEEEPKVGRDENAKIKIKVINIPEKVSYNGEDWTVVAIGSYAFINERGISKINLPKTIEAIEDAAFYQSSVTMLNFPTSLKYIGWRAFYKTDLNPYVITKVERRGNFVRYRKERIPIHISGATAIGPQAFEGSFSTSQFECPQITFVGYQAFKGAKFIEITIPASAKIGEGTTDTKITAMYGNLPSVTDYRSGVESFAEYSYVRPPSYAQSYSSPIKLVEGPTTIPEGMFEKAFNDVPQFFIPLSVTTIEKRAFANTGILSFNELSKVTKIGASAFENGIMSGDFVIEEQVEEVGDGAFAGNTKLEAFILKGSANCKIGVEILEGCLNLEYVDLRNAKNEDFKKNLKNLSREFNSHTITSGLPTHTVVYLPDAQNITIADGQDVNFVKSDGTCTKLSLQDGTEYEFPYAITASEVVYNKCDMTINNQTIKRGYNTDLTVAHYEGDNSLTSYRDFSKFADGKHCFTIFLPYAVTLPTGIRAYNLDYQYDGQAYSDVAGKILPAQFYMFTSIPDGSTLEANRPYLLRITDGKNHDSQKFKAIGNPVVIDASGNDKYENCGRLKPRGCAPVKSGQGFYFYGSTEGSPFQWKESPYMREKNPWVLQLDRNGKDMWKRATENKNYIEFLIPPFRAFIMPPLDATSPAKEFMVLSEGETTGISDVIGTADAPHGAQRIYTIDGRYVGTNFDSLPSGMYIMKGKKTLKTK